MSTNGALDMDLPLGGHQGIFSEQRGSVFPGDNPWPDGGNLYLYRLSGKETARLAGTAGCSDIMKTILLLVEMTIRDGLSVMMLN